MKNVVKRLYAHTINEIHATIMEIKPKEYIAIRHNINHKSISPIPKVKFPRYAMPKPAMKNDNTNENIILAISSQPMQVH